jgi:opacity protein-like surface antigen
VPQPVENPISIGINRKKALSRLSSDALMREFRIKRSLFASVSVLALTLTAATAADLPARSARMPVKAPELAPVWSWTGFYVGINGGGVWHRAEADVVSGVGDTAATTVKASGGTFGGQIGANWQVQQFVLGIEADGTVDASAAGLLVWGRDVCQTVVAGDGSRS